jgi:class 3 adenylate cyclase
MTRENLTLAILFADIAKSTHLYEALGNTAAKNLISTCLSILSDVTTKHNGTVIKTIGDELMCTFPTAQDAVEASKKMHQELEQMTVPDKPHFEPPNIYVGIQYGPVIREEGDVFGDAVNVAARMVAFAKQRQVITTEETVRALPPEYQDSVQCIDKTTVKGKSGKLNIYEVIWEEHDVTVMLDDSLDARTLKGRLELTFLDNTIEVGETRPTVTMGRQSHNDIIVNDNRVSRTHARVEYRRGKFVLVDQSSNGTYLLLQGKESVCLKRNEEPLIGKGVIGLGREMNSESQMAIHFSIKL